MSQGLNIWLHNNPFAEKTEAKPHSDAILQQLLQNTLNTSRAVKINKNSNGKPYTHEPVSFSHSNSAHLYAYILSTEVEVAIDLEIMKPKRSIMKLAQRYFHADEYHFLKHANKGKQNTLFYQLWTQKEAWCKLDGGNLWSYLSRSVLDEQQAKNNQGEQIYWTELTEINGFAGSLASTQKFNTIWINNIA